MMSKQSNAHELVYGQMQIKKVNECTKRTVTVSLQLPIISTTERHNWLEVKLTKPYLFHRLYYLFQINELLHLAIFIRESSL